MGSLRVAALASVAVAAFALQARGAGPGGWDHVGSGVPATRPALNGTVSALRPESASTLLVGGSFTDAGGDENADFVARWDGRSWRALGAPPLRGAVNAIAARNGRVYVGGIFRDAGGDANADYVAVWDGRRWAPACTGPPLGNPVYALEIVGSTLYVGGTFTDGAGVASADFLLACDLGNGSPQATVGAQAPIVGGGVYALAADSRGRLYAGGAFSSVAGIAAANKVAYLDAGGWQALGSGPARGGAALDRIVRSLATSGTNVYVGTDAVDIAGIAQADHVARFDGSRWSALGANRGGGGGWLPRDAFVNAVAATGSRVFAGGRWSNADGAATADNVAEFEGGAWRSVGSNGSGDGPLNGDVSALATHSGRLYAGGSFANGGGDPLARFLASFPLAGAPPGGGAPPTTTTTPTTTGAGAAPGAPIPPPTGTPTGTVLVNGRPFTGGVIPYGATVDVTNGRLVLRTTAGTLAVRSERRVPAVFRLLRGTDRQRPIVELRLVRGDFGACPRRRTRAVHATPTTVVRAVWGDGKGRFRTKGRYASATVRGTNWLTADRCDGTFVRVRRGVIEVRDVPQGRQVRLPAPRTYLARP